MTKDRILAEIKRIARECGGIPPGKQKFETETGIGESSWSGRFWARWGDALREAGFSPNAWQVPHEKEFLIQSYVRLIRELGRFPVKRELSLKRKSDLTFPASTTFARLGSKSIAAKQIMDYCRTRAGYEDVIKICEPVAIDSKKDDVKREDEAEIGFVYLLKSGRHYKIGRSNSAGRREYELAIQLPDKVVNVHTIRTDDPAGIEAYWHNRFAAKRRGGEWFNLDAADVNAFRRRKFM